MIFNFYWITSSKSISKNINTCKINLKNLFISIHKKLFIPKETSKPSKYYYYYSLKLFFFGGTPPNYHEAFNYLLHLKAVK